MHSFSNTRSVKTHPQQQMEQQVPDSVKEARNHDLLELINSWAKRRSEPYVGTEVEILCEGPSKTNPMRLMGRTRGNKIVVFEGAPRHIGRLLKIRIDRSTGYTLYGEPVSSWHLPPPFQLARRESWAMNSFLHSWNILLAFTTLASTLSASSSVSSSWLVHLLALVRPEQTKGWLVQLPRSKPLGIALLAVDSLWSFWLVSNMDLGEFSQYRTWLQIGSSDRLCSNSDFRRRISRRARARDVGVACRGTGVVGGFSPARNRAFAAGRSRLRLADPGSLLGRHALPFARSDQLDYQYRQPLPSLNAGRTRLWTTRPGLRGGGVLKKLSVLAGMLPRGSKPARAAWLLLRS